MSNQDPDWQQKAQAHNALTILTLSLFAQPLVIFGVLYWALSNATDFSQTIVIGLAALTALLDFLTLSWIIKMIKRPKDGAKKESNRIG